jgi:hypothetical protein
MTIAYSSDKPNKYTCNGCGKTAQPEHGTLPGGWGKGGLIPIDAVDINGRMHFCETCFPKALADMDGLNGVFAPKSPQYHYHHSKGLVGGEQGMYNLLAAEMGEQKAAQIAKGFKWNIDLDTMPDGWTPETKL